MRNNRWNSRQGKKANLGNTRRAGKKTTAKEEFSGAGISSDNRLKTGSENAPKRTRKTNLPPATLSRKVRSRGRLKEKRVAIRKQYAKFKLRSGGAGVNVLPKLSKMNLEVIKQLVLPLTPPKPPAKALTATRRGKRFRGKAFVQINSPEIAPPKAKSVKTSKNMELKKIGRLLSAVINSLGTDSSASSIADINFGRLYLASPKIKYLKKEQLPVMVTIKNTPPRPKETVSTYFDRINSRLHPLQAWMQENGVKAIPLISANALKIYASPSMLKELTRLDIVEKMEFEPRVRVSAMDDVQQEIQEAMQQSEFSRYSGKGVRVAILDSGVDTKHPYLNVLQSVSTCGESINIPGIHGTHCAGILASRDSYFKGIAPDVELLNIKVMEADEYAESAWVTLGMDEALLRGAEVVSMSLSFNNLPDYTDGGHGWDCSDGNCPLCRSVNNLFDAGICVVVAAGNMHNKAEYLRTRLPEVYFLSEIGCPGNAARAITVGSVSKRNYLLAGSSSWGPSVNKLPKPDVVATGVNITSTFPTPASAHGKTAKIDFFGRLSGTSMATPIVAGVAARVIEKHKAKGMTADPAMVKKIIQAATTEIAGYEPIMIGNGRLDFSKL